MNMVTMGSTIIPSWIAQKMGHKREKLMPREAMHIMTMSLDIIMSIIRYNFIQDCKFQIVK